MSDARSIRRPLGWTRVLLIKRDGLRCYLCKQRLLHSRDTKACVVDHVIPVARGGTNQLWNLRLVHRYCNARKGAHIVPMQMPFLFEPTSLRRSRKELNGAAREGTLTILVYVRATFKREFEEVCRKRGTSQTQAVQDALLTWMVAQDELIARAHEPGLSGDR